MMNKTGSKLKPLGFSCTTTDCKSNLHCFKQKKSKKKQNKYGACRDCGAELVDWDRVHKKKLRDVNYTFNALKNEYIRHFFWHSDIDQGAKNHVKRKGEKGIRIKTEERLRKYVSIPSNKNPRDGRQTPFVGNIIYYAQHATACCCRKCMEYWHDIPPNRDLTDEEIRYFTDLAMCYINERMPDLTENGEKVPPIRSKQ